MAQPSWAMSFGQAKSILKQKVYGHKGKTFYCGCLYQARTIDLKSCRVLTKEYRKRKDKLEWEHVVPAHAFGQSFSEWRMHKTLCPKKGARKCARKHNKLFATMEGDPHNLVPAVGSVNALRSNYSFAELQGAEPLCEGGLKILDRKVMPPESLKGDVARIYFYMNDQYPGRGIISGKNKKLFEAWNKLDPVNQQECERELKIRSLYKKENKFVSRGCKL